MADPLVLQLLVGMSDLHWFWEQNNGPREEQQVVLMMGSSPQHPSAALTYQKIYFWVIQFIENIAPTFWPMI